MNASSSRWRGNIRFDASQKQDAISTRERKSLKGFEKKREREKSASENKKVFFFFFGFAFAFALTALVLVCCWLPSSVVRRSSLHSAMSTPSLVSLVGSRSLSLARTLLFRNHPTPRPTVTPCIRSIRSIRSITIGTEAVMSKTPTVTDLQQVFFPPPAPEQQWRVETDTMGEVT